MAAYAVGDDDTWGDWLKALVVFLMLGATAVTVLVASGCGPMPELKAGQTSELPEKPGNKPLKFEEKPREMIRVQEPENPKAAAEKAPDRKEVVIPKVPTPQDVFPPPAPEGAEHRPEVITTEADLARVAALETAWRWEIQHVKAELVKGTTLTPAMTPDEAVALIRAAVQFAQKENIAFVLKARRLDRELLTMADSLTRVVAILEDRAAHITHPSYRNDLAASRQKLIAARNDVPRRRTMVARYLKVLADMEAHWEESEFVLGELLVAIKIARAGDLSPPESAALLAEVMARLKSMVEALKEFDREVQSRMAGFGEKPKVPAAPPTPADPGIDEPVEVPGKPATPKAKDTIRVTTVARPVLPLLDPPLHRIAHEFSGNNEFVCSDCGGTHRGTDNAVTNDRITDERRAAGRAAAVAENPAATGWLHQIILKAHRTNIGTVQEKCDRCPYWHTGMSDCPTNPRKGGR